MWAPAAGGPTRSPQMHRARAVCRCRPSSILARHPHQRLAHTSGDSGGVHESAHVCTYTSVARVVALILLNNSPLRKRKSGSVREEKNVGAQTHPSQPDTSGTMFVCPDPRVGQRWLRHAQKPRHRAWGRGVLSVALTPPQPFPVSHSQVVRNSRRSDCFPTE